MSDTHTSEYADEQHGASPGKLLQQERERQAISLEDAALALHLRPAVVAGLERDQYAEIPVATYRRGYLRTYAKYLGMDDKPVLDAYRAHHGAPDTEREVKPVAVTRPPSRVGGLLFKLVTLLVIVGLIGVTVTWWQSRGGNTPPGLDDTTATQTAQDEAITSDSSSAPSTGDNDEPSDTAESGDTPGTEPNPRAASTAEPEAVTPSREALAAAAEVARLAQERAQAEAANTLALTFNQQSWTEIFDARDRRVFVGLQQPGTEASVEGQPPFRLTVGNATGVELRYQGKVVDLAAQAGANNVARFTLGE